MIFTEYTRLLPTSQYTDKDVSDVFNKVLGVTAALSCLFPLARGVGGPQGQIVPQQLHDQGAVLVAVLVEGVQLGDGIVKCLR